VQKNFENIVSKLEIRSTKSETILKFKFSNVQNNHFSRLELSKNSFENLYFEHLILFRISIFRFQTPVQLIIQKLNSTLPQMQKMPNTKNGWLFANRKTLPCKQL